jgi:hypothetical protein
MSNTITTINTAQTGTAGSAGQPNGGDGESLTESGPPFSDENFTSLAPPLELFPKVTGGLGGGGEGGGASQNGVATTVSNTDINGDTIVSTTWTPGFGGVVGGQAGEGGGATIDMANDSIGTSIDAYQSSLTINALTTGGQGGTGGTGGNGGTSGSNFNYVVNNGDGTTTTNESAGAAGGGGGAGGSGGNAGSATSELTGLTSFTQDSATVTLSAIGGVGGDTLENSGGNGGSGGDASEGGLGGDGGDGGNAAAMLSASTMLDHDEITVSIVAKAGVGGAGGSGGIGGPAVFTSPLSPPNVTDNYGINGNGGNGGHGGSATATLTGNNLTAPQMSIELSAEGNVGGIGGIGGSEGTSHATATMVVGVSAPGATGSAGTEGSGSIIFTNNIITVGSPAIVGFPGELTLNLSVINPVGELANIPLDGAAGGNLQFAGNDIAGGGDSTLELELAGTGTAVINTLNNTLSIDGSPENTMTGFGTFDIDNNDTFYVGPGAYLVQYSSDADTLVYTPQSGDATLDGVTSSNIVLNFQGFGASLTAQDVQNDTTTSDGSDFIHIPNAGSIELVGFSGAIPSGDIEVTAVCFCAGTRIATPTGEVPVEHLSIGDTVLTANGAVRPITWFGTGRVLATRGRRNAATPVIVRRGALADNVPHRDLHVTKGHSLFLDGVLIPVEHLVNHRSIIWDERAREVTIYHIELETHDVLIADGAPAESYRDDGNRWQFRNANSGWCLPAQPPCAPVLTGGPIVDAVWRRLPDRTASRNGPPLTREPDLHLLVDGKRIDAIRRSDSEYAFRLTATPRHVRIRSRAAVPQEVGVERDERALGVALRRIVLAQPLRQRSIDAKDTSLTDGFHTFEADHAFRWTNGDAAIPAELFAGAHGPCMLMLQLGATAQYIDEGNQVTERVA